MLHYVMLFCGFSVLVVITSSGISRIDGYPLCGAENIFGDEVMNDLACWSDCNGDCGQSKLEKRSKFPSGHALSRKISTYQCTEGKRVSDSKVTPHRRLCDAKYTLIKHKRNRRGRTSSKVEKANNDWKKGLQPKDSEPHKPKVRFGGNTHEVKYYEKDSPVAPPPKRGTARTDSRAISKGGTVRQTPKKKKTGARARLTWYDDESLNEFDDGYEYDAFGEYEEEEAEAVAAAALQEAENLAKSYSQHALLRLMAKW
eukprot:CAMPEP_0202697606 /NCGR_PEP_ID=MMETSP1385-20130828/10935_1 /ASSEMBLY_ACC=CAM_ASM_000861 /TAXON_ID=933848 /ORGANISM="Elphidium margaritaceum" /LENGTH=256 /DNA_ID=CAMNT_0049354105 /DNA_START=102 /DNA_END=869 /DNA_ORIENTATION=-